MQRLLWVLCINGALLALEGIIQRGSGTNKLLWMVEPRINNTTDAQFGPYAYRSNAAQYLTLLWPVAIGFWWVQHQAFRRRPKGRAKHNLLIPCAVVMAAAPLISLSRAGAVIGLGGIAAAGLILAHTRGGTGRKEKLGVATGIGLVIALAIYAAWPEMAQRLEEARKAGQDARIAAWENGLQMAQDYPLFGTGPNTFEPLYQFYAKSTGPDDWMAQLHNDWLETLITFGWAGSAMILLLLGLVFAPLFLARGIGANRVFVMFLMLGLGGSLAHGAVDFPFQIYSILFLFLVLCAITSCVARGEDGSLKLEDGR